MSRRNGDRSRFHIDQKRKILKRQRVRAMIAALAKSKKEPAASK